MKDIEKKEMEDYLNKPIREVVEDLRAKGNNDDEMIEKFTEIFNQLN